MNKKGKIIVSKKKNNTFYVIRNNKTKKFFTAGIICLYTWTKDPLHKAVYFKRKSAAQNKAKLYHLKDYTIIKVYREIICTWREIK